MNRYCTSLKHILNADYVEGGELLLVENILLKKSDGSAVLRSGVLVIFDGYVWFFEEIFRVFITGKIKIWKEYVNKLADERNLWRQENDVPRCPPPILYPILHLSMGTEDFHPDIIRVTFPDELDNEVQQIEYLIERYYRVEL